MLVRRKSGRHYLALHLQVPFVWGLEALLETNISKPTKISKEEPPTASSWLPPQLVSRAVAWASLLFFPLLPAAWLLLFHLPSRHLLKFWEARPTLNSQEEVKAGGALNLLAAAKGAYTAVFQTILG